MASIIIIIFTVLAFLIPSELAATNIPAIKNPVIILMTDGDENLDQSNVQDHKSMSFDVNKDSYEDFIQRIRDELRNSDSHGIPVLMPQRPETPENAEWLDIRLVAGDNNITIRVEQSNLYIRGYSRSTDGFFWQFPDMNVITGARNLSFSGSYSASNGIANVAGVRREELPLGFHQLENAIHNLATLESPLGDNAPAAARSLLVLAQMIAEAARFQTISDHIGANYWNNEGVVIDGRMVDMENGWGQLSTALLRADLNFTNSTPLPNVAPMNPTQIYTIRQAVAALGILVIIRPKGGGAATMIIGAEEYGRPLMNLEYVRVNNIDNEDPGDLFGSVRVDDGWFTYTFYDRSSGSYESVAPGGYATLTDSAQSFPVSGADEFTISVDLYDYDTMSPNDKIAQGEIVWDRTVESVTFANYDKHLQQVVSGDYGDVTVGYSVLTNALAVTIQVELENGDGEDPADVYGTLKASQVLGGSDGSITLFDKSSKEYVEVRPWHPIPLTRTVIAASTSTKLTITADLWDYDSLSPNDEIAKGSVDFTVQPGTQRQDINGEYGKVQVVINCV